MITARLRESSCSPELILESHRLVMRQAYREKETILRQARKRARSYVQHARRLGHESGYAAGEQECAEKFRTSIEALGSRYREVSRLAQNEVAQSASELVEQIVESRLQASPTPLQSWIQQALGQLSSGRVLVLRYHPRYEEILSHIASVLPRDIRCEPDPSLGTRDFVIESETGAVECAWRELISLSPSPFTAPSQDI